MTTDTTAASNPTDDEIVANTAEKQYAAIVENLRRAKIAQASQAAVEAKLKADGINLDDINVEHLAQQRLQEMVQHSQLKAADAKAKELYKALVGVDFTE